MALTIANNVGALNAQHNLNRSSTALNKSIERLSSGFKINRGADGPAALVISEKQRAQIAGLRTAIDNTEKAASVVQTAEGALNEINSLLVKVRGLALDSANSGANFDDALAANQAEITNALDTINRIASNTQFASKKLLDGSSSIQSTAADTDVTLTSGATAPVVGTYAIDVTQAAEKARVSAGTAQTGVTTQDETLTVNGTDIAIATGSSQSEIVDLVNAETATTGVVADVDSGALRFTSSEFGSSASISVVSDVAATATSSGVGAGGSNAVTTAGAVQSGNTAVEEIVTINSTDITIAAGSSETDVVDAINAETGTTGVVADRDGTGALRLTADSLGAGGDFTVTSNVEGTTSSTGLGTGGAYATETIGQDLPATLGADEVLTIDGLASATINLSNGDDSTDVLNKINAETANTGVVATLDGAALVLTSNVIGSGGDFSVTSDVAAGATSTGVGTTQIDVAGTDNDVVAAAGTDNTAITDDGVDIAGTLGGETGVGAGSSLTFSTGDVAGAVLTFGANATDDTLSVTGGQGDLVAAGAALQFQIGANQNQTASISIANVNSSALGQGVADNQFSDLASIDVTSGAKSQDALGVIDAAIDQISSLRGDLGAFQQNTLESTANNLRATLENTVNAESVIRDTDFAEEIENFTKQQVLVQAGTNVLRNATQSSQLVLGLLG